MIDEYAHVPAGISHLELGRVTIYEENPPLIRTLAALPAWLAGARVDYESRSTARVASLRLA